MSASLTWMLVKDNNCFLRKQRHSGGVQLSLEPYNLDNKNRFTSSGLANGSAVDVSSGANGITMKLKGNKNRSDKSIINCFKLVNKINGVKLANDEDWGKEFLDKILSVKVTDNLKKAIEHINKYNSNHTDSIITKSQNIANKFFSEIDSAIVMHNVSTQFADGGEFGMGAEIGIGTGKLHARGPIGAKELTSFKFIIEGKGNLRK